MIEVTTQNVSQKTNKTIKMIESIPWIFKRKENEIRKLPFGQRKRNMLSASGVVPPKLKKHKVNYYVIGLIIIIQ